jgi:hypothetical protein
VQHSTPHQPDAGARSRRGSTAAGKTCSATPAQRPNTFSKEEWVLIEALRDCYECGQDLLSQREQMRLRFLKWLVDSDRLEP